MQCTCLLFSLLTFGHAKAHYVPGSITDEQLARFTEDDTRFFDDKFLVKGMADFADSNDDNYNQFWKHPDGTAPNLPCSQNGGSAISPSHPLFTYLAAYSHVDRLKNLKILVEAVGYCECPPGVVGRHATFQSDQFRDEADKYVDVKQYEYECSNLLPERCENSERCVKASCDDESRRGTVCNPCDCWWVGSTASDACNLGVKMNNDVYSDCSLTRESYCSGNGVPFFSSPWNMEYVPKELERTTTHQIPMCFCDTGSAGFQCEFTDEEHCNGHGQAVVGRSVSGRVPGDPVYDTTMFGRSFEDVGYCRCDWRRVNDVPHYYNKDGSNAHEFEGFVKWLGDRCQTDGTIEVKNSGMVYNSTSQKNECRPDYYGTECQYTDYGTCNGGGAVDSFGQCTCHFGFKGEFCDSECNDAGKVSDGECICDLGIQGRLCDSEAAAAAEAAEFKPFYIAAGTISAVTFLGSACYAYDSHASFPKVLLFAAFVTLRIFDTMSDWAMCFISLKSDRFIHKSTYGDETGSGNHGVLHNVALAFTIIGTLLLTLDLLTLRRRAAAWFSKSDALDDEERKAVGLGMGAILFMEDTPQLAIAVVYLMSVEGFTDVNADDTVVMLSLVLSILSLLANGWMSVTFTCSANTIEGKVEA